MKYLLLFTLLFGLNVSFGQDKDYEILGKALAESIVKNDSLAFYNLILPKEAAVEFFKSMAGDQLSAANLEMATESILANYEEIVTSTFALSFFNLTTKAEIFDLDLSDVNYEVVETNDTKDLPNVMAIHGSVDHHKFPHFTFYAIDFEDQLYLASHLISISETDAFKVRESLKKVDLSADENGYVICQGILQLEDQNAPKKEILNCLLATPIVIGLQESSEDTDEAIDKEYIRGKWEYGYYVNNTTDLAGRVSFKYEFIISDGVINYRYYDFTHDKGSSEFNSIGKLPFEINDAVLKVFTNKQYREIMGDIRFNHVANIKRLKEFADKCFK
ncbi:hypothetical protein [Winogradskyella tangerina]|uniref:hypothetical protein n=1 Tax=Winogradskyella tangerina TaxID=2023240 RepID=UPI0013006B0B|nr:hypothetical protein [Winogradskyella tangerina]